MLTGEITYHTDPLFVAAIRAGNRSAFRQLYTRFAPVVMGFIHRAVQDKQVAENLLYQTFLSLWESRTLAGSQPLVPWVLSTARSTLHAYPGEKDIPGNTGAQSTGDALVLEAVWYRGNTVDDLSAVLSTGKDNVKMMLRNAVNRYKASQND